MSITPESSKDDRRSRHEAMETIQARKDGGSESGNHEVEKGQILELFFKKRQQDLLMVGGGV